MNPASLVPSLPSLLERKSGSRPSIFSHSDDRTERMVGKILIVLGHTRTRTANRAEIPGNYKLQHILDSGRRLSYTPNIEHIVS